MLLQHLAVRDVEDDQFLQAPGMRPCYPPGHASPPIVPDQDDLFVPEGIDQPDHIGPQRIHAVSTADPGGFSLRL